MNRFKSILVYAGSAGANEPALREAACQARRYGASVEVVDVIEELPAYARLVTPASWDVAGLLMEERKIGLRKCVGQLEEEGVRASSQVLRGKPAIEIARHVLHGEHDLVLKTAHPEVSPQRLWHGVLAKRLVRICPCPVWIIQPDQPRQLEQIVAAIDPNADDLIKTALNQKIVEMAASLAENNECRLHLIHTWAASGETLLRSRVSAEKCAEYVADCQSAAQLRVDRFVSGLDEYGCIPEVHLIKGDPSDVLTQFVATKNVDLVVMGSVCRTGVAGYLIGNTAEKVLGHLSCSVLAVKPDDFECPIDV